MRTGVANTIKTSTRQNSRDPAKGKSMFNIDKGCNPELERADRPLGDETYVLRLYVASMTPRSVQAIVNIKAICEEYLKGQYDLEVIDIYQQPERAAHDQVVAVPTLIKKLPPLLRKLVGELFKKERVLLGLGA